MKTDSRPPSRRCPGWAWTSGPALAALPLLIFLKSQGLGLLRPESLMALGVLAVAGLPAGVAVACGGRLLRAAAFGAMVTAVADVQTDWFHTYNLRMALTFLVAGGVGWLAGRRLTAFLGPIALAMFAGTLLLPASAPVTRSAAAAGEPDPSLPLVVHIILDEHLGVAGIPPEHDPDGAARQAVARTFLERDFTLFERAFSRYDATWASLAAATNFVSDVAWDRYCTSPFHDGNRLTANAWLEGLQQQGYRVSVYQNHYLDLAAPLPAGTATTATWAEESLSFLDGVDWRTADRGRCLAGLYLRRSFFLQEARRGWQALRPGLAAVGVAAPAWPEETVRLVPLAASALLDEVAADLGRARRGEAYLAHVLLPHSPYAFTSEGALRPEPWTWAPLSKRTGRKGGFVASGAADDYVQYLGQMTWVDRRVAAICDTLRSRGLWDDALVIVHGDHGSRLDRNTLEASHNGERFELTDNRDSYSTLAAVKLPGGRARTVAAACALEDILAAVAAGDSARLAAPPVPPDGINIYRGGRFETRAVAVFPVSGPVAEAP